MDARQSPATLLRRRLASVQSRVAPIRAIRCGDEAEEYRASNGLRAIANAEFREMFSEVEFDRVSRQVQLGCYLLRAQTLIRQFYNFEFMGA